MKNQRRTHHSNPCRRSTRLFLVGIVVLLAAPFTASGSDELTNAEARFEAFESQLSGAATATRRRLLEGLRNDLNGEVVLYSGAIYNLSEISLTPSATAIPDWGVAFFSWEHEGLQLKDPPADPSIAQPTPLDKVRFRIGKAESATLVILQGDRLKLYALTADQDLIDKLRSGAEQHVEVLATGLQGNSMFGFLLGFAEVRADLRCTNGHNFEQSTGFSYCPYCGKKLTVSGAE